MDETGKFKFYYINYVNIYIVKKIMECDRIYKAFQDYRAKKEELEKNYENQKKELENKYSKDNKAIEQLLEKEIMKYMHNNKNLMEFLDKILAKKRKN